MRGNSSPFVLKPYTPELTGWRRIASWLAIPILSFVCLIVGFFYALTTPYLLPEFAAPLIILAMTVIWSLPDIGKPPVGAMQWFFFGFLYFALLWPNYLAIVLPGMPWITAIRLLGFPLAFTLLISVSISPDFRAQLKEILLSIPNLWKLIGGFAVIQVVSVAFSNAVGDSLNQVVETQVSWTAMYFVACYVFSKPGMVERWAIIMWVAAMLQCFNGLWEAKLEHVPWAGHIPSFLQVQDEYVDRVLGGAHRLGTDKYRVQGTHSTALGLAEFLALTSAFVMHFMMGNYKFIVRVLAGLSLPFIFFTILQTDARLGVVGFFTAALLYVLCWGMMRWRLVPGTLLGPAVVLTYPAVFALFMAGTMFIQRLHRMVWGGSETKYSNEGRMDQVAAGMPKILSHPWGYGIGRGASALDYHNLAGTLTIDTYYLLVALDYGVLGFLVYYSTILVIIYSAGKYGLVKPPKERERTFLIPAGIALTAFFIIKSIFSQVENHTLQFMMMGMVTALVYRIKKFPEAPDVVAPKTGKTTRIRTPLLPSPARAAATQSQLGGPRSSRKPARHPESA